MTTIKKRVPSNHSKVRRIFPQSFISWRRPDRPVTTSWYCQHWIELTLGWVEYPGLCMMLDLMVNLCSSRNLFCFCWQVISQQKPQGSTTNPRLGQTSKSDDPWLSQSTSRLMSSWESMGISSDFLQFCPKSLSHDGNSPQIVFSGRLTK